MAEYIEREAVLQFAFNACAECMDACAEFDGINPDCHQCMLEGVKLNLRDMRAADVAPIRHGRWIYNEKSMVVCSICGNVVAFVSYPENKWKFGHYCPNCGAKMDKEEDKA